MRSFAFGLLIFVGCSGSGGGSVPDSTLASAPAPAEPGGDTGASTTPPPASQPGPSTDPATRRSAGCGKTAAAGLVAKTVTAAGKSRTFTVSIPERYDATHAYALVVVHHGAGDTDAASMRDWFVEEKDFADAVYVYPQALPRTRADGSGDDIPRWDLDGNEDLSFFDALVADVLASSCVDTKRVFASGFSSGGNFAQQLGCLRSSTLRAFATVAGPGPFTDKCGGPMPVWMTHDVDDDALPVEGARESRDFWAAHDSCGTTQWPPATMLPSECTTNTGCPATTPIVYCETKGIGHDMPSFAPKAIAAFFDSFR